MKTEIKKIVSTEDILSAYSGRRLQYAIRLGILPKPERLNQLLKRKISTEKSIKDAKAVNSAVDVKPVATNLNWDLN